MAPVCDTPSAASPATRGMTRTARPVALRCRDHALRSSPSTCASSSVRALQSTASTTLTGQPRQPHAYGARARQRRRHRLHPRQYPRHQAHPMLRLLLSSTRASLARRLRGSFGSIASSTGSGLKSTRRESPRLPARSSPLTHLSTPVQVAPYQRSIEPCQIAQQDAVAEPVEVC